jgi:hypothetical protein
MKISSRPIENDDVVTVGSGTNRLMLTDEQLELVAALVAHCRLGQGGYSQQAFELLELIEEEFGSDFIRDACDLVNVHATIEDDATGMLVCSTKNGGISFSLEV